MDDTHTHTELTLLQIRIHRVGETQWLFKKKCQWQCGKVETTLSKLLVDFLHSFSRLFRISSFSSSTVQQQSIHLCPVWKYFSKDFVNFRWCMHSYQAAGTHQWHLVAPPIARYISPSLCHCVFVCWDTKHSDGRISSSTEGVQCQIASDFVPLHWSIINRWHEIYLHTIVRHSFT